MITNDATAIGIPRINEPILTTDELSKQTVGIYAKLKVGHAILISLDDDEQRFLIDNEISVIGREPNIDIFLNDYSVSRRHADISCKNGRWYIEDLGSLNGTYVNRELIESTTEIKTGDEVQIGRFHLGFYSK